MSFTSNKIEAQHNGGNEKQDPQAKNMIPLALTALSLFVPSCGITTAQAASPLESKTPPAISSPTQTPRLPTAPAFSTLEPSTTITLPSVSATPTLTPLPPLPTATETKEAPEIVPNKYEIVVNYTEEEFMRSRTIPQINNFNKPDGTLDKDAINAAVFDAQAVLNSFAANNIEHGPNGNVKASKKVRISKIVFDHLGQNYLKTLESQGVILLAGIETEGKINSDLGIYQLIIPQGGNDAFFIKDAKIQTENDVHYITGTYLAQATDGVWYEVPGSYGAYMVNAGADSGFVLAKIVDGEVMVFDPSGFENSEDQNDWYTKSDFAETPAATSTLTPTPSASEWQSSKYAEYKPNDIASLPEDMQKLWNETIPQEINKIIDDNRDLAFDGNEKAWLAKFPTEPTENMVKFYAEIKKYRRGFLLRELGFDAATVESMTDMEVLFEVAKWGIENKQMVLITQIEDMQFLSGQGVEDPDYNPSIIACIDSVTKERQDGLLASLDTTNQVKKSFDSRVNFFNGVYYNIPVFGTKVKISHPPDNGVQGRFFAVSPIAGVNSEEAVKGYIFYQDHGIANAEKARQYGIYPVLNVFESISSSLEGEFFGRANNDDGFDINFSQEGDLKYPKTYFNINREVTTSLDELEAALGGNIGVEGGNSVQNNPSSGVYPLQLGIHQPMMIFANSDSHTTDRRNYVSFFPWEEEEVSLPTTATATVSSTPTPTPTPTLTPTPTP